VHSIQYVGLLGSAIAFLAGVLIVLNRAAGSVLAAVGLALLWLFYGPALMTTVRQLAAARSATEAILILIPGSLLLGVTMLFLWTFRHGDRAERVGAG
jgi:hypothetical protein